MSEVPPLENVPVEESDAAAHEREAQAIRGLAMAYSRMREEIGKVIVGQRDVVDQLLIAMFSGGHSLLIGVPGLAKTLLVNTLSRILSLSFRRIQFTPDLMPSDITGTDILRDDPETGQRSFQFMQGPIFTNILLADEINRTPPKTQAALLEAMQEHQVTAGGRRYALPEPFFVLATQNPIEMEGTYPLPEAQLDRFMFNVVIDYLPEDDEVAVVQRTTAAAGEAIAPLFTGEDVLRFHALVRKVPIAEDLVRFAVRIAAGTRPRQQSTPAFVNDWVSWGAGTRAAQFLSLGAKARALLSGRSHVTKGDIIALAAPVLRHRVLVNYRAEAEGVSVGKVIERVLAEVQ